MKSEISGSVTLKKPDGVKDCSQKILAIDPGTFESAWAYYQPGPAAKLSAGKISNEEMLELIRSLPADEVAIERVASYGMPVGAEVFETCEWVGAFKHECERNGGKVRLIYRKDVKLHLCQSPRAKDSAIRQRLIDLFGKPGTKKAPGFTFGLSKDTWQAFALAVTAAETELGRIPGKQFG